MSKVVKIDYHGVPIYVDHNIVYTGSGVMSYAVINSITLEYGTDITKMLDALDDGNSTVRDKLEQACLAAAMKE